MTFGSWLKQTMKAYSVTTSDIAKATKSHHNVVRSWERSINHPSAKKYALLIKFLAKQKPEHYFNICKQSQDALLYEL